MLKTVEPLKNLLTQYGHLGVEILRQDVSKVSATHKTEQSVRYEVSIGQDITSLTFFGRKFFKTLETGRGPRKGTSYQEFDNSMYDYMVARGIGSDLPEKKRRQLAKFLAYRINKEGDQTFKNGGRIVYSANLTKLVTELKQAVAKHQKEFFTSAIVNEFANT